MNSGVCVKGSTYAENELDYFGILEEVMELTYLGSDNTITLFKCHWFDPTKAKVDKISGIIDVKHRSTLQAYEPFILAAQAQQVYYAAYPAIRRSDRHEWWAVCKVKSKLYPEYELEDDENEEGQAVTDFFQANDTDDFTLANEIAYGLHDNIPLCDTSQIEEVDLRDIPGPSRNIEEEEEEEDEEEDEEEEEEEEGEDSDEEDEFNFDTSESNDEMCT